MDIFAHLAAAPIPKEAPANVSAWWQQFHGTRASALIDRAMIGGFAADRLGYAFAAGYQCALRALVPDLSWDGIAALCASEEAGAHPKKMQTQLAGGVVSGQKQYVSMGESARQLLVVAREPEDKDGHPSLKVVLVDSKDPGVSFGAGGASAPFIPEIPHSTLTLKSANGKVLPGDGYARYVKPFRTVEDIYVTAAIYAYSLRLLRQGDAPPVAVENALSLLSSLHLLSTRDPLAPGTHLTLAGLLRAGKRFIGTLDPILQTIGGDTFERWQRDRALFNVAEKVRTLRTESAWKAVGESIG